MSAVVVVVVISQSILIVLALSQPEQTTPVTSRPDGPYAENFVAKESFLSHLNQPYPPTLIRV